MNCRKCRKLIALHAGGDLADAEVREVEGHLSACEACRDELAALSESITALRAARATEEQFPADDPSYRLEVETKMRSREIDASHLSAGVSWWFRVPRQLAQAALVLVVAGVVVWLATSREEDTPQPGAAPVVSVKHRSPPMVLVFERPGADGAGEVETVSADNDVIYYSDFGGVRKEGELRRFRERVVPAAAEDEPF